MENKEQTFLNLAKEIESDQEALSQKRELLESLMQELGIGAYLQDLSTKAVYKVVVPKGRFVSYSTIDYVRTALEGERAGSLSKKEAQEKGFKI